MATKESSANFSGKSWGGYCQITYTAGNGSINITGMAFKATNSTTAGYGAYYDNQQSITVTAGSQSRSCTLSNVRVNSTSYQNATFSGASFSGLSGNTNVSFTCRARGDSPNTLTFSFTIDAGNNIVVPTVSNLSITATNETTIKASFTISSNGGATATGHITCNGTTKTGTSATFTVSAGTKYTVTAYASNSAGNSATLSGSVTTPAYPTLTSAPDFTLGNTLKIQFTNPLSRSVTVYIIAPDGTQSGGDTTTGTYISGYTGSTFVNWLYSKIPSTTSGKYKVRLVVSSLNRDKTYSGGTFYAKESVCTPTFSNFTWEDTNDTTYGLTGSRSTIVKGYSEVTATISVANKATLKKSATPSKSYYEFKCGSDTAKKTYSEDNPVDIKIPNVTSNTFKVRVTDARGYSSDYVTKTASTYKQYSPLTKTSASISRVGKVSTETTLTFAGTIWNNSFGNVNNAIVTANYKYKTGSGSWSSTTSIKSSITVSGNNFSFSSQIAGDEGNSGFDVNNVYTIRVTITDKLSTLTFDLTLNSGVPHIAYHKNGVSIMGKYNTTSGGKLQVAGVNIYNLMYPVGSTFINSTNTNPNSVLGFGTWSLIDKVFTNTYGSTISTYWTDSANAECSSFYFVRSGHSIHIALTIAPKVAIGDTAVELGTLNLDELGITNTIFTRRPMGYSDSGNVIVGCSLNYTSGVLSSQDVFPSGTLTVGNSFIINIDLVTVRSNMVDAKCNQFVWRRTA